MYSYVAALWLFGWSNPKLLIDWCWLKKIFKHVLTEPFLLHIYTISQTRDGMMSGFESRTNLEYISNKYIRWQNQDGKILMS